MENISQQLIDDKEILIELGDYYNVKVKKCSVSIENAIECLAERFLEDKLPPTTNSVLETLENFEITENLKIPSPIQIGYLKPLISDSAAQIKAIIDFIAGNGICIELNSANRTEAHQFLQNIGLKILMSLQAGLANVILLDPEGSGANFKLLLGYEKARPNLILNKSEIGTRLADVLKTFNKLQTENLTFKYDNLEELNINEPKLTKAYTFLFISNYPAGFKKEDRELLESIISKGAKFGTFVFMSYDSSINTDWNKTDEIRSLIDNMLLVKQESDGYKIYNGKESEVYNKYYTIEPESDYPSNGIALISFLNEAVKKSAQKSVDQNEYFGKVFQKVTVAVNPAYTSQECSSCGVIVKKTLSTRTHVCRCGCVMDRDKNAARNILSRGLGTVGHTGTFALNASNALGDESST